VVSLLPPLFCLFSAGAFGIIFEYTLEQFERRRYRNVLDRYVSKNVAKTILEDRRSFVEALKGRKKPVTVLFSDIRGFTTMTESADADKLVAQLNEYFRDMVGSVLDNNGTLQKFIGDAIMAVFTQPVDAAAAGLEMLRNLRPLNKDSHRGELILKIGIHHGAAIAVTLNGGIDYFGQTVNIASRVQGSAGGNEIFLTEEIYRAEGVQDLLQKQDCKIEPIQIRLRGIEEQVKIYRVISEN